VTFLDGTTTLGTGPVTLDANGQATYTTSSLSPGLHVITASYGGDTSFNSASGLLNQLVSRAWTVSAWGYNENGELGNGGTTNSDVPVPVSSLAGVVAVAGAGLHSLALKSDGTVWAWGDNGDGELGNGGTTNSDVPVPVSSLTGVAAVAGGGLSQSGVEE
jgi:hypothetical protein